MSFSCSVYGLGIRINVPIAGLASVQAARQTDVEISLGTMLPCIAGVPCDAWKEYYICPELEENEQPGMRVLLSSEGDYFRIEYLDGTLIIVNIQGTLVWSKSADGATIEDTATYLLGPTLGFVLRLRGITCLHASAVAIGNSAIALVGPAGSGKSTLAAAFARLGYAVLTDDVLALADQEDGFMVQPAYPRVRLWPESVNGLFGSEDALPRITPNWDKRFLDLNTPPFRFQREPLPLGAIYFLDNEGDSLAPARIEAMAAQEGMMALVANTYANYLLDKPMRAKEFEVLGRLVENVPLRRVISEANFECLPDLCRLITADSRQVTGSACTA